MAVQNITQLRRVVFRKWDADKKSWSVFTLEADNAFAGIQNEFMPEMLKYMYSSAKKVVDKIEEYKNAAK